MGRELMQEAIVDYLNLHRNGVRRVDIARALGLLGDPNKFTRVLISGQVQILEGEAAICSEERGGVRLYFPVADNQGPVTG